MTDHRLFVSHQAFVVGPERFETADAFFAAPSVSLRNWHGGTGARALMGRKLDRKGAAKRTSEKPVAARSQVAALPLRVVGDVEEVCLVTTRETRRWTIPKGWPMKGLKDHLAAGIEAEQEAGLYGKIARKPVGRYLYWKRREAKFELVNVSVFRLDVAGMHPIWREQAEREVRWFPLAEAVLLVDEPGLAALIAAAAKAREQAGA